eukprot:5022325-Pleurochrysis_carterae.AAC.3
METDSVCAPTSEQVNEKVIEQACECVCVRMPTRDDKCGVASESARVRVQALPPPRARAGRAAR